jgi:hypothetical protein
LQPPRTSMPVNCSKPQQVCQDTILRVLYGADLEFINSLIKFFASNIAKSHEGEVTETLEAVTIASKQGLDYARAVFILLLNIDVSGKKWICTSNPASNIGALCGNKAPGFFSRLSVEIVPNWQRNEAHSVQLLVEKARSAYLVA